VAEDKEDTEESQTERADKLIAEQELEETDTVRNVNSYFAKCHLFFLFILKIACNFIL
jgi:hypothetical protein